MAGYGKYYKSTAGIVFNNRTSKLNIFGNYTYDNNKGTRTITTNRNITYNETLSNYDVDYNNIQKTTNHNFKIGADYTINPKQTIGFLVSGIIRSDDFTKHNDLYISNQHQLDSVIRARSNLDRGSNYLNYNINYNAVLDKSGRSISVDGNYSTYTRHSNEFITNSFFTPAGNTYRDDLELENLSPSDIHIWTSKVDFVNPLNKTSRLETGIKYNNTRSNNNLIFGPKINNIYEADPNFSNRFLYTEAVSAGYINYVNKIGKWDITAGVRAENTHATGKSWGLNERVPMINTNNYFNLFPQLQISYEADKKHHRYWL
ncbi:outer membrane beta-barrel family protein [Mucilaginibacter sp. P19]|uniref:outer membrane beta-barrel family protein n=1 Tax=Mucilaginibacter sp. P19 TaxID=3423947 RepID=UPI003D67F6E2